MDGASSPGLGEKMDEKGYEVAFSNLYILLPFFHSLPILSLNEEEWVCLTIQRKIHSAK
jgi:hypothetical protein